MIDFRSLSGRTALIGFAFALLLAWVCYRPALSGAYQLDDVANLGGLSRVSDFDSALDFTLAGEAGPLGRPVVLATFAMQAESWTAGATAFLRTNVLVHLLNGVLLAFCLLRLALCMRIERARSMTVAALAASAWLLMPLLATSSLLVVQRMTTLSATFVLLGLAAYLVARSRIGERPVRALVAMSASLVAGTVIAMLCKESGMLLPVYVLALEATVLQPPGNIARRSWRRWQAVMLILPLAVILAYLATQVSYPDWVVLRRDFTAGQRLLTETQLLWLYLSKALLGWPDALGIFQTATPVTRSLLQPLALLATSAWLLLLVAAILWRRRFPLAALAVLWFLAGHLLESTVVPLELYFEHRNYLPIIGPLFALSAAVLLAEQRLRRAGLAAMLALIAVNAVLLYSFAALWGEPSAASRHWAMRYPDSVRAVMTMAQFQLDEEGPQRTIETIDSFVTRHPQHAYLRLQQLNLLCRTMPGLDHSAVLQSLRRELLHADFTISAADMLSQLFDASVATACVDVTPDTVVALANRLRQNPRYTAEPGHNQFHEKLLAAIARYAGDNDAALDHIRAAIAYQPSPELNMMMVTALASLGKFDEARRFIDDASSRAPFSPLRAVRWHRGLDELRVYIHELEKVTP